MKKGYELFKLKQEIQKNLFYHEITEKYKDIKDQFLEALITDADQDHLKTEDPEGLEFYTAEAIYIHILDWNEDSHEINFLKYILKEMQFTPAPALQRESDLTSEAQDIYNQLYTGTELYFWNILSKMI